MYLELTEYAAFTGETMAETLFNELAFKAQKAIDIATFNRLKDETPVREAVKRLMVELIRAYNGRKGNAERVNAGVSSVSNDGVSISYTSASIKDIGDMYGESDDQLIRLYLGNEVLSDGMTPVLSKWVYAR